MEKEKKKSKLVIVIPIAILIIIVGIIAIVVGTKGKSSETSGGILPNTSTYKLNASVESDILKLTLNKAQFAIALENTNGENFATPKEYDATKDSSNPYVAAKGHTLVAFTFTLENLDRSSVDIGGSFNSSFTSVKYKGNTYNQTANFKAESENVLNWKSYSSSNILLSAGKTMMYRAYIDIPIDVEDLGDTFELDFYLPNSKGKTDKFTFVVTEDDRNNQVEEEISLDVAFDNFTHKKAYEYFTNHYTEFEIMNGNEIKEYIDRCIGRKINVKDNSFSDDGKKIGYNDKDSYEFISTGDIKDNYGFVNKNKWKIEGDKLILSYITTNGEHIRNCEVRRVPNKGYLLIWQEKPYAVFY